MDTDIPTPGHHAQRTIGLPSRLIGDERLAQEAGAGSERAFAALFQRYHQQLYRYCRGLTGSDQDAQDALQTTFTKALVALRAGRRNAPLRPWLYRIAHNESISLIRSRNAVTELPLELEAARGVADSVEAQERMAMLIADLRELPEQQRGALVMRELSGLSHEEIAAVLQVSVGAAKQSILEARRSLLEFAEGRAMRCDEIQRIVSDDDRRSLRSRRVRAHLRDCGVCAAFAEAIPRRRADMLALWPVLPAATSAGLLAKITGAGSGHGGGAGLAAGTAAKGIGATISAKAAAAAGAAVVATATVGAVAVIHHNSSPGTSSPSPISATHHGSGAGHGSAGGRGVSLRAGSKQHVRSGTAAGSKHAAGHGSHGQGAGSHGSGPNPNGAGVGASTAPGRTHTNSHASTVAHGSTHTTHKQAKVNPSVGNKTRSRVHHKLKRKVHRRVVTHKIRRKTAPKVTTTRTTHSTTTHTTTTRTTTHTTATHTTTTHTTATPTTTTKTRTTTSASASTTSSTTSSTDTTSGSTPAGGAQSGVGSAGNPGGSSAVNKNSK